MPDRVRDALLAPVVLAAAVLMVAAVCAALLAGLYILAQVSALLGGTESEYSDVLSVLMRSG